MEWRQSGRSYATRYKRYIYQPSKLEPISRIAQDEGLSEEVVQAVFEDWAKKTLTAQGYPRVNDICFDEITLHKGHGKYLWVTSAPEFGLILDVLEDRSKSSLLVWLEARGKELRGSVEAVSLSRYVGCLSRSRT